MEHLPSSCQILHNAHALRWSGSSAANNTKPPSWRSQRSSSQSQRAQSPYHFPTAHPPALFQPTAQSLSLNPSSSQCFPQPPLSLFHSSTITDLNTADLPRLSLPGRKPLPLTSSQPKSCGGSHSPPSPSSSTTTISDHQPHAAPHSFNVSAAKLGSKRPRSWEHLNPRNSTTALPPRLTYKAPFQSWTCTSTQDTSAINSPRIILQIGESFTNQDPPAVDTSRPTKARVLAHPLSPTSDDNLSTHVAFDESSLRNSCSGAKTPQDGPTPTSSPNVPPRPCSPAIDQQEFSNSGDSVQGAVDDAAKRQSQGALSPPLEPRNSYSEVKLMVRSEEQPPRSSQDDAPDACDQQGNGLVPMQLEELTQIGMLVNMGMLKLTAATRKALAASLAAQQGSTNDEKLQGLRALLEGPSPTTSASPSPTAPSTLPPTITVQRHQLDCSPDPCPPPSTLPHTLAPALYQAATPAISATTVSTVTASEETITDPNGSGAVTSGGSDTTSDASNHSEGNENDHDPRVNMNTNRLDQDPITRTDAVTGFTRTGKNLSRNAGAAPKALEGAPRETLSGKPPCGKTAQLNAEPDRARITTIRPPFLKSHPLLVPFSTTPSHSVSPRHSSGATPSPKGPKPYDGPSMDPIASGPLAQTVPQSSAFHRLTSDPDLRTMLSMGVKKFDRFVPHNVPHNVPYSYAVPTQTHPGTPYFTYTPTTAGPMVSSSQLLIIPPHNGSIAPWPSHPNTSLSFLAQGGLMCPVTTSLPLVYPPAQTNPSPASSTPLSHSQHMATFIVPQDARVAKPDPRVQAPKVESPEETGRKLGGSEGVVPEEEILSLRDTVLAVVYNQKELDGAVKPNRPPVAFGGDVKLWRQFLQQLEHSRAFTQHLLRETANLYSPPEEPTPSPRNHASSPPTTVARSSPLLTSPPTTSPPSASQPLPKPSSPTPTTHPAPTHKRSTTPKYVIPMISPGAPQTPCPAVSYEGYWTPPESALNPPTANKCRTTSTKPLFTFTSGRKTPYPTLPSARNLPRINPTPATKARVQAPGSLIIPVPSSPTPVSPSPFTSNTTDGSSPKAPAPIATPTATPTPVPTVAIPSPKATAPERGSNKYHFSSTPSSSTTPSDGAAIRHLHSTPRGCVTAKDSPTIAAREPPSRSAPSTVAVPVVVSSPSSPHRKRFLTQAPTVADPPSKRIRGEIPASNPISIANLSSEAGISFLGRSAGADKRTEQHHRHAPITADMDVGMCVEGKSQNSDLSQMHPKRRVKKMALKSRKLLTPDVSCSSASGATEVMDDADAVEGLLQLAGSRPLA